MIAIPVAPNTIAARTSANSGLVRRNNIGATLADAGPLRRARAEWTKSVVCIEITDRSWQNRRIRDRSATDSVTGLPIVNIVT
jgi:hypothetical protein